MFISIKYMQKKCGDGKQNSQIDAYKKAKRYKNKETAKKKKETGCRTKMTEYDKGRDILIHC